VSGWDKNDATKIKRFTIGKKKHKPREKERRME